MIHVGDDGIEVAMSADHFEFSRERGLALPGNSNRKSDSREWTPDSNSIRVIYAMILIEDAVELTTFYSC